MTHEFQPRSLPDANEYATAADSVQRAMDSKGLESRLYFSMAGLASDSTKEFSRTAIQLANSVELTSGPTGEYADPERRRGRALYLGAVAGYSILREIYGVSLPTSAMLEYIPPFTIDITEGDATHNTNSLHDAIVSLGLDGSKVFGNRAVGRLNQWSEKAVTRPEFRPTFVAGSGLIALAGVDMQLKRIEQFQIHQLHEHVESDGEFDWDSALLDLNSRGEQ